MPYSKPKTFLVGTISCNEFFIYPVISHQSPLVMISRKPDFKDVRKRTVFEDLTLGKMAVIIKDRSVLGKLRIKSLSRFVLQQKIFLNITHPQLLTNQAFRSLSIFLPKRYPRTTSAREVLLSSCMHRKHLPWHRSALQWHIPLGLP